MHLGFCLLYCYATKSTSSRLSTYICDWESRSPKPSSLAILHRKKANKVFGKHSTRLLDRFSKFIITTCLPLRWSCAGPRHIYHKLRESACGLQNSITVKEDMYVLDSRIMSYILNISICVGMILLDILLQWFLFITVIDLASIFHSTFVSLWNLVFSSIIYFWIKIKLKMLIFPTGQEVWQVLWILIQLCYLI
jgi:hypothetical protein